MWKKDKEEPIRIAAIDSKNGLSLQTSKVDKNNPTNKLIDKNIDNLLKSRKELSIRDDKTPNQNSKIIQTNKIAMDKPVIKNDNQEKVIENKPTFRNIEFNYPEWKPQLEVTKQTKHLSESEKDIYKSFIKKENDVKKNLLINIDA